MRLLCLLFLSLTVFAATLDERLAKWKVVKMEPPKGLNDRDRHLVEKLVEASRYMEAIYWEQSDPEALRLLNTTKDARLRRLITIHGSRFDLIDENAPFTGTEPVPPGRNIFPKGLTRDQIESYVKQHPAEKDAIYSGYTVLRSKSGKLEAIPYHVEYKRWLEPSAKALREAADLTSDKAFAAFLRKRAKALLTDDYYPSDLLWVDLKDPKIDVIFGPYETYLDGVLGVKTSYSSAVLIRNEPESAKLRLYQKYVPDIQDALPVAAEDRPSKKGQASPMEVMDSPYRTGDLRHGYQAVADNLPNDPRIHKAKGTKKIFFKNFMDARVEYVVLPVARQLMRTDQAAKASGEGYLAAVILHEICHGLGPAYSRVNGKQVDIREAIGPVYGALEEAKADIVGMFGLKWLVDHDALPKNGLDGAYSSFVAGIFRTVRYGTAEAHGRAEMMEFNYLSEQKAISMANGRYVIDYAKMPTAIAQLAKQLLAFEAAGDRKGAEQWFNRYDKMPAELTNALKGTGSVPVDVDPVFPYSEALPNGL